MKNILKISILFFVITIYTNSSYSQMQVFYWGIHYEKGSTINSRLGWIDTEGKYLICDMALPTLIAALCGWRVDTGKVTPVEQIRYFSMRGGRGARIDNSSSIAFDFSFDFMWVYTPPDSGSTHKYSGHFVLPVTFGPAYLKAWSEKFSTVLIPSWGWSLTETREGDNTIHKRLGLDLYLHYLITDGLLVYSGVGYGYYHKGLPKTYPYKKSFGGMMFTLGIAF